MYSALRLPVIALLLAAVAGCGQMGPLYLPEAPAAEQPPVAAAQEPATEDPATAADTAKPDDEEG